MLAKDLDVTFCYFLLMINLSADFHILLSHVRVLRREISQLAKVGETFFPLPFRD